jgi:SAM-dependent methyltransferase
LPAELGQTRVTAVAVCPICEGRCTALDVVDFNKSCEEIRGKYLPLAGVPIYYYLCEACGFCFAPELLDWTIEDFERDIYNEEYERVDPDYIESRPRANAKNVLDMLDSPSLRIRHLDYGGGNGRLSELLFQTGWDSTSYDPFVNRETGLGDLGSFDLITAFEVFEHVPDVNRLASDLASLLRPDGVVIFTTLLSDGNISGGQRLTWWYASPRNGHISLFSKNSLIVLAGRHGFKFGSLSAGWHAFWRTVPPWAERIIG